MSIILFSPVGSTDPIRNFHDGSMLHIVRHFQPDVIHLYFSHEMSERQEKDGRYTYCLEKLSDHIGKEYKIKIHTSDLIEVQDYEIFYDEFYGILKDIIDHSDPGDEILVNIASGTPAMKSALLILAVLGELPIKPIQVSTPIRRSNYTDEDADHYDAEEQWNLNMDNEPGAESRCEVVHSQNLLYLAKLNVIKRHLESYNYSAAWEVGKEMSTRLPADSVQYLEMAFERINRNITKVNILAKETGFQPMPVTKTEDCIPIEFMLSLQAKQRRGSLDDFIRAVSPIIWELFHRTLLTCFKVDYKKYAREDRQGSWKWDPQKLKEAPEILHILEISDNNFDYGYIYSRQLKSIIAEFSTDDKINRLVEDLRVIEEKVRNKAAHTMIPVTEDIIVKWTGFSSSEIMEKIKTLAMICKLIKDKTIWDSYDEMNTVIISSLH